MKVIFLGDESYLGFNKNEVLSVFCIRIWDNNDIKFYVKGESRFVYPDNSTNFQIIDNSISEHWIVDVDADGCLFIGPPEIKQEYFWENYYNDVSDYSDIVNKYIGLN